MKVAHLFKAVPQTAVIFIAVLLRTECGDPREMGDKVIWITAPQPSL